MNIDLRNDEKFGELLVNYATAFSKISGNLDPEDLIKHIEGVYSPVGAGAGWQKRNDVQWMNIVNYDRAYESYSKDDAVHKAVKRTEAKLKELNAGSVGASTVLTDERIGELYLSVRHIGHATNRELAFARAIEREVAAQAGQVAVPDVLFDGFSIFRALDKKASARTSAENVSDVLDAIVRVLRPSPAKESK